MVKHEGLLMVSSEHTSAPNVISRASLTIEALTIFIMNVNDKYDAASDISVP